MGHETACPVREAFRGMGCMGIPLPEPRRHGGLRRHVSQGGQKRQTTESVFPRKQYFYVFFDAFSVGFLWSILWSTLWWFMLCRWGYVETVTSAILALCVAILALCVAILLSRGFSFSPRTRPRNLGAS